MYVIINGRIITETEILRGYDLYVEQDRITGIYPERKAGNKGRQVIDAAGGYVTPGFIDIHSDYIEHMAAPRPTALIDFELSIRETEKELISHGITTMFHSLSLYKWNDFLTKPIRAPENVTKFIDLIDKTDSTEQLIRHRFHARFEIDNCGQVENLKSYLSQKKVDLVSFMDHTPGQGQYRNLESYRHIIKGYQDIGDRELDKIIERHQKKEKVTFAGMKEIADMAIQNGIAIASHDDDSVDKLEMVKSLGAIISEFPITIEIAKEAKARGMYTVAGAPNVLLGGSHNGNLSAVEAIAENCIDVLCSDYYPAALLHAVFKLNREYGIDLVKAFGLLTKGPAEAVKMESEIGSIKEGKKADILIIKTLENNFPVITTAFVDGELVQKTNYRIGVKKREIGHERKMLKW